MRALATIAMACVIGGCGGARFAAPSISTETRKIDAPPPAQKQPEPSTPESPKPESVDGNAIQLRELFPHVRADVSARMVEFDGTVPIDCHHPETPVVYLEVTVCTPDTKEHESLVVTNAKPSHVHAALLAVGFASGAPGRWKWDGTKLDAIAPTGDPLEVSIAYRRPDGQEVESPATSWITNADPTGPKFAAAAGSRFVFAGSAMVQRQRRELYDADGSGLLIGLTTFGSESIAWSEVISHDASIEEPEWIADTKVVPKFGTPVVVRIRPKR